MSQWSVVGHYEIPKGVASFPQKAWTHDNPTGPVYVLVAANGKSASLTLQLRESADGSQIWVHPGTVGAGNLEEAQCTYSVISASEHQTHSLLRTPQGRWALLGLSLAIVGIVIDGSLKIGTAMITPLFVIGRDQHAFLLVIASLLQISGLFLVFMRALRRGDL